MKPISAARLASRSANTPGSRGSPRLAGPAATMPGVDRDQIPRPGHDLEAGDVGQVPACAGGYGDRSRAPGIPDAVDLGSAGPRADYKAALLVGRDPAEPEPDPGGPGLRRESRRVAHMQG